MKSTYTNTVERGILTSAYKREIRESIFESRRTSLSNMKSMIENHQENIQSQTGIILRVSVFMLAIIFMVA